MQVVVGARMRRKTSCVLSWLGVSPECRPCESHSTASGEQDQAQGSHSLNCRLSPGWPGAAWNWGMDPLPLVLSHWICFSFVKLVMILSCLFHNPTSCSVYGRELEPQNLDRNKHSLFSSSFYPEGCWFTIYWATTAISLSRFGIRAEVGSSQVAFSCCSFGRMYEVDSRVPTQAALITHPVASWTPVAEVQRPMQVAALLRAFPPETKRGNPTDHSNSQRVVITLVQLNVLVNKAFWVCLICSKIFLKIGKKPMLLHNTLYEDVISPQNVWRTIK